MQRRKLLNDGSISGKNRDEIVAGDILCAKEDGSKIVFDAKDAKDIGDIMDYGSKIDYTINLNDQWQLSTSVSNPDSRVYDGVYESFNLTDIDDDSRYYAKMTITINDMNQFDLYIRSCAEDDYHYVMVSQLDQDIDEDTLYSDQELVKAHTCGNHHSGSDISDYKRVHFTGIGGGEHTITIVYRRVGSDSVGVDKGYVLIPKQLIMWVPIGVVVIPPSHDVYGTGEGAVVSLRNMDYSDPDIGNESSTKSSTTLYWGQYGVNTELTSFNTVNNTNNAATPAISAASTYGCLPSDNFTGIQCTLDPVAYYRSSTYLAPSPYLSDGSRYEGYYTTEYIDYAYNALSDFDGVGNTNYLCSIATAQPSWKTSSSITSRSAKGYSAPACCCWRYHTTGTNQGDWYLPAAGEMGYLIVRWKTIYTSISNVCDLEIGVGSSGSSYWTSSEALSSKAYEAGTYYGFVERDEKNGRNYVLAFLRF